MAASRRFITNESPVRFATALAGLILAMMGILRLGRLIQFVPHPVTTGLTAGIAVVIAVIQLGDYAGVGRIEGERIWERLLGLVESLGQARWSDITVGVVTLTVLIGLPRLTHRIPAPLVALVVAVATGSS